MKPEPFKLEVFFDRYEFSAPYLLTQSDCESLTIKALLSYEPGSEDLFLNDGLGYTPGRGNPSLRQEIAKLYSNRTNKDVVVHTGAQEAIFNFMNVFLSKEDHVITLCPAYQSLFEVAKAIGCQVSSWSLTQAVDGWELDMEKLAGLIQPNTKLICLNTPNNPTGYTLSKEEMDQITHLARPQGIYVFSDEVYKGLEHGDQTYPSFADVYEKAVSLGVMSKAYGLAGLRIGWVAAEDSDLLDQMLRFKHYTSICNSGPSEFLARIALKHGEKILKRNRGIIQKNLEISDAFFKKHNALFQYNRPESGPIGFHRMKMDQSVSEFCEQMVSEKGVLLLPADIYSFKGNYFRMGYGRKDFSVNMTHFEDYLKVKSLI